MRNGELNEDAIRNAFAGPPPTHIPIYVFTDRMTVEEWGGVPQEEHGGDQWRLSVLTGGNVNQTAGVLGGKDPGVANANDGFRAAPCTVD
jgi:hypothetical protein